MKVRKIKLMKFLEKSEILENRERNTKLNKQRKR